MNDLAVNPPSRTGEKGPSPGNTLAFCCVALAVFALSCACALGAVQESAISRAAAQISSHQVADGAIVMGTNGDRVVPYFANLAAMGLVTAFEQGREVRYLDAAKKWISWYEAHLNADGTICDYSGRFGAWTSTRDFDSSDAYAATFIELVLATYQAAPDESWLKARLSALRKAYSAVRMTMQPNRLTMAKPGSSVMFLMDNTEVLRGLRAMSEIAGELGETDLEREAAGLAARTEEAIKDQLWIGDKRYYSPALHANGQQVPFTANWYPDVMANLMAIGWGPHSWTHRDLFARLKEEHRAEIPASVASEPDLTGLVWWGIAAVGAGDTQTRNRISEKLAAFDSHLQSISNPALLGHLCRVLASSGAVRVPELRDNYDIIVAGAGTGGFGAAMQASRLGASVLLIEETDYLGGQMSAAAVTSMDEGPKHKDRPYVLVRERGIYSEFAGEVSAHYKAKGISAETAYWGARLGMEPRVGQEVLYRMLNDARIHTPALHVSLRTTVAMVHKTGTSVSGVTLHFENPDGNKTLKIGCKVLVDATEWGDVIPLAGADYRVGNCTNGAIVPDRAIQDLTWTAAVKQYPNGVPQELLMTNPPPGYAAEHPKFMKSLVQGAGVNAAKTPWNFDTFIGYRGMPNTEQAGPQITRTHLNYNNDYPTRIRDVEDPAVRENTLRSAQLKTLNLLYYIQNTLGKRDWSVANDEGYDSPYNRDRVNKWLEDAPELEPYRSILYHFPVMAYARESRRIIGLHTLSAPEIERIPGQPRMFETSVAIGDYPVDLHGSKKPELLELELENGLDIPKGFGDRGSGPFAVPFESFIPVELDGFLPAEKNISQSRLANGATRLQPSTMLTGQAAGAIAGLAVKYGVRPRDLDSVLVQMVLLRAGDTLHITPFMDVAKSGPEWPAVQLVTVRGLMTLTDGNFRPGASLTRDEMELIIRNLWSSRDPVPEAVTRASFIKVVRPMMLSQGVDLDLSTANSASASSQEVTRLEAAQVLASFLEARALSRLHKEIRTNRWPVLRSPTPMAAADLNPSALENLRILTERGIIDSPEYWLRNGLSGGTCDGKKVADLLRNIARKLQPRSDPSHAIDVCASAGIIGSPDYWNNTAAKGLSCSGEYVANVIERAAARLSSSK